ncbi:DUF2330 domain-containing protein [Streptomyces fuscichromogenes]|uniref:DUF2330 domain-containing protein n=1 Tax=Streptomyces fuscichromogenes TaxID=1324013 RepID=A0A917UDK5_9ACTN|nr:DUF2330 domain-containing protein [Streptomyces fuscichromogenes]GGM85583.1 hypothetical protein GCM10011578_000500 [Streptomyces fuscichromogenes]
MIGQRRPRRRTRLLAVLLVLAGIQFGWLAAPAFACACGALVPDTGRQVTVGREESVLRWDGTREQIVMRLTVNGDADRAAWIMPVPHRATVTLSDPALFDQLHTLTAPVHRTRYHFWPEDGDWPLTSGGGTGGVPPGVGATAPGVGVVDRQRLGPFDVAQLTATDSGALDGWLRSNGFPMPPRLDTALQPYVTDHWEYVAVKLAPETTDTALRGALDPLHLAFASERPVYPMRLSRIAATPQSLGLYVLAAHRMEPRSAIGGERPRVVYAGRLSHPAGALAQLAAGTPYLTAIGQEFPYPSRISADHTLRQASSDTPFQQVVYTDRLREAAGIPAWLLTIGTALLLLVAVASLTAVRRSRRPAPPPPPPTQPPSPPAGPPPPAPIG